MGNLPDMSWLIFLGLAALAALVSYVPILVIAAFFTLPWWVWTIPIVDGAIVYAVMRWKNA